MNQIIVGMGEALWDVLPEGKKIGGAPANFAYQELEVSDRESALSHRNRTGGTGP